MEHAILSPSLHVSHDTNFGCRSSQAIAPKLDEMDVSLTRTGVVRKLDEMPHSHAHAHAHCEKKLHTAATDIKEEKKGGTLVELTKIASRVIARDQLTAHIDATVDTNEADYAIVSSKTGFPRLIATVYPCQDQPT